MKLSVDKIDTSTAYADLGTKDELNQKLIDKAVEYANDKNCDHVEIHKDGKRLATYMFDGSKVK